LNWSRNGEQVASIQARPEDDRVTLSYRYKTGGADWQAMDYPVWLEWTACTLGGRCFRRDISGRDGCTPWG
jgi:hypothetical protein